MNQWLEMPIFTPAGGPNSSGVSIFLSGGGDGNAPHPIPLVAGVRGQSPRLRYTRHVWNAATLGAAVS